MRFPYDDDNYIYENENENDSGTEDYDDDEITNQIYFDEEQYIDIEKTDGSYYLGSVFQDNNYAVLDLAVSAKTFYNYDIKQIEQYISEYSNNRLTKSIINIIKLHILPDLTYSCILKTHWLILIQKHWRKTFALLKEILKKRKTMESIKYFELYGKYMDKLQVLPSIRGIMNAYTRNT